MIEIQEEKLLLSTLDYLNTDSVALDALRSICDLIKESCDIEAVGIRIVDGEDYPYYSTRGFPADFVELERYLCKRDHDGRIARGESGHPILECMCGNVICGRTDPTKPFFTPWGSFWTNCTTDLLAGTTEADRQGTTRNRCNGRGYESVALVPLRDSHGVIGLLQLNDRRKGMFDIVKIHFFERLGAGLGAALTRKQHEALLRDSNSRLEKLVAARTRELESALEAKETLLREAHHRIKNNLNVTSSLLKLQALGASDDARKALTDAATRVNVMGVAHARFAEKGGMIIVEMHDYISELCHDLADLFGLGEKGIALDLNLASIVLNADTAVPVGLICNEILTNSFKHAFTDRQAGVVNVSLVSEGSRIRLVIEDNGPGLPSDFDPFSANGLGMSIVHSLVNQIDASARFWSEAGLHFELVFAEVDKEKERWGHSAS